MSSINLASLLGSTQQTASAATTSATASTSTASAASTDFASSLKLQLAELESQSLGTLINGASDDDGKTSTFGLTGTNSSSSTGNDIYTLLTNSSTSAVGSVAASGMNTSLADPVSAYNMMSVINEAEVEYQAQYAELSQMGEAISGLSQSAATLGSVTAQSDDATISAQLQAFADSYNAWITRFGASVGSNGVLAGTQAAEVSLHELEVSVENRFNGAAEGYNGLADLGLSVDQETGLVSFDANTLASALASDKSGVVATLQDFSSNFTTAANLLTSTDNFIDARLDNLDRAIDYIAANKTALQSEFGTGAAATPSAQVAAALATYQQIYASQS